MNIRKEPSGRFRAVFKVGREYVAPTGLDWSASTLGGTPGAQIWRRGRNDKGRTPPNLARLRWSDGVPVGWS